MEGWMEGWMDGWMDGWVDGRMDGWMGGWKDGWMDGWMNEWMDKWMNGWMNGRTVGPTDGWINIQTDGWINIQTDGWMSGTPGFLWELCIAYVWNLSRATCRNSAMKNAHHFRRTWTVPVIENQRVRGLAWEAFRGLRCYLSVFFKQIKYPFS